MALPPGLAVAAVSANDVPRPAFAQNHKALNPQAGRVGCQGHRGRGGWRGRGRGAGSGRHRAGEEGCPVGRSNYSTVEVEHMLESIRESLPISGAEWDLVADHHY